MSLMGGLVGTDEVHVTPRMHLIGSIHGTAESNSSELPISCSCMHLIRSLNEHHRYP